MGLLKCLTCGHSDGHHLRNVYSKSGIASPHAPIKGHIVARKLGACWLFGCKCQAWKRPLSKRELKSGDRVRVRQTGACGQVYSKGIARDAHVTVAWDNGYKGSICVALLERIK